MVRPRNADVRAAGDLLTGRRHFVVFNPASGHGRGALRIATYRRLLEEALADVTFATTARPGEERDLAERAASEGYDIVVAMGGDGTWSSVANGILASGRDEVALGVLPSGTGNDFARNFGYDPGDTANAVRVIADGHIRRVDVGRVDSLSASDHAPDHQESRHFLNLIGFGFDIAVIEAAAGARFLKGALLYKVTALMQLFRFPGFEFRLATGGGEEREGRHLMLTISNGRYFGGGFPIAPEATVGDGLLHACMIGDAPPLTRLKLFTLAERGRHVTADRVEILADMGFRLRFDEPPRFELDGELRCAAEATMDVRIVPGALRVVAPAE